MLIRIIRNFVGSIYITFVFFFSTAHFLKHRLIQYIFEASLHASYLEKICIDIESVQVPEHWDHRGIYISANCD